MDEAWTTAGRDGVSSTSPTEPDIARVPVMIDSVEVGRDRGRAQVRAGQERVNSISLKEGEENFLRQARLLRPLRCGRRGHGVLTKKGQADTYQRKSRNLRRAYKLLVDTVGFPPKTSSSTPMFALATGPKSTQQLRRRLYRGGALDSPEPARRRTSGGISNMSFSFRGNDHVREAMHTVFLYHAIGPG